MTRLGVILVLTDDYLDASRKKSGATTSHVREKVQSNVHATLGG